nr:3-keto sterol reductase [Cryptococcus depauperatus CBS 7841]
MACQPDPNRVIAVVTGANSGYGLGVCQQLLTNLSLPSSVPMPGLLPQATAVPPLLRPLIDSSPSDTSVSGPETTLTLVLACRSQKKAQEAKKILLKRHEKELQKREARGLMKQGWREGLHIVWEGVDLDRPGGDTGVLSFCDRLRARYPHITSLFLNAGMGAFCGLDFYMFFKQIATEGLSTALSQPKYDKEIKGAMSSDGERGLAWGTNVLAPYIMARELLPLLRNSPTNLSVSQRIVYTSSGTALFSKLQQLPLDDHMLLSYPKSYGASKYMGDLVMLQLDRELNSPAIDQNEREVRVLTVDPGCVATNFFNAGLGEWSWLQNFLWFWYWTAFYVCRLLGSPYHPVYPSEGAKPMVYAALVPSRYLIPATQVSAQRFSVRAQRWGNTKVEYAEIDNWEKAEELGLPKGIVDNMEDLIATLSGNLHAGQQGNDLRDLHVKLSQTLSNSVSHPHCRPTPPAATTAIASNGVGMPPPAPASSWSTPPPTGFLFPALSMVKTQVVQPENVLAVEANDRQRQSGEQGWSIPMPNMSSLTPRQPTPVSNLAYPSQHQQKELSRSSEGIGHGERPYHAAVLPIQASPKDIGGFEDDAFRPLWAQDQKDQWSGFKQQDR